MATLKRKGLIRACSSEFGASKAGPCTSALLGTWAGVTFKAGTTVVVDNTPPDVEPDGPTDAELAAAAKARKKAREARQARLDAEKKEKARLAAAEKARLAAAEKARLAALEAAEDTTPPEIPSVGTPPAMVRWPYGDMNVPEGDPRLNIPNPDGTHVAGEGEEAHLICDSDNETKVVHPADGSICPITETPITEAPTTWVSYFGSPPFMVDFGLLLGLLGILVALWNERRRWSCLACGTENGINEKVCAECKTPRPSKPGEPVPCSKFSDHAPGKPGTNCSVGGCEGTHPEPVASSAGLDPDSVRRLVEVILSDEDFVRSTLDASVEDVTAKSNSLALLPLVNALKAMDMEKVAEELNKLAKDSEANLADPDPEEEQSS